jgi:hypothetical protein
VGRADSAVPESVRNARSKPMMREEAKSMRIEDLGSRIEGALCLLVRIGLRRLVERDIASLGQP